MSDKPPVNPDEDKQGSKTEMKNAPGKSAKKTTLVVSIATSALLVSFAAYTLLKTEFKTYPESQEFDIAAITQTPDSLIVFDDTPEETETRPNFNELLAAEDPVAVNDSTEEQIADYTSTHQQPQVEVAAAPSDEQRELEALIAVQQQALEEFKSRFADLELSLAERTLELAYLHEEHDATLRQLKSVTEEPRTYGFKDPDTTENLTKINEELQQQNLQLETQLSEAKNRIKQLQEGQQFAESRNRESENRARELGQRNIELAKRQEVLLKDKALLESQLSQSQQKLAVQERSFQEVGNALKLHKEAMKRMDQARMALASELDSTKNQYAKLLQAVAAKAKEAPGSEAHAKEIDLLTAAATPSVPAAKAATPVSQDSDTRYHVVGKGDTLTSISRQYYGTTSRWHEIYDANQAVLTDHNRLKVGLVLVIP